MFNPNPQSRPNSENSNSPSSKSTTDEVVEFVPPQGDANDLQLIHFIAVVFYEQAVLWNFAMYPALAADPCVQQPPPPYRAEWPHAPEAIADDWRRETIACRSPKPVRSNPSTPEWKFRAVYVKNIRCLVEPGVIMRLAWIVCCLGKICEECIPLAASYKPSGTFMIFRTNQERELFLHHASLVLIRLVQYKRCIVALTAEKHVMESLRVNFNVDLGPSSALPDPHPPIEFQRPLGSEPTAQPPLLVYCPP